MAHVRPFQDLKDLKDLLRSEMKQGFSADPFHGRARYWPMLGEIKIKDLKDLKNLIQNFESFVATKFRGQCDQVCTTRGPQVRCVKAS